MTTEINTPDALRPLPTRETVRVRPMYLVPELYAKAVCAVCKQRPRARDVWLVHIDREKNDKDETKCQSFMACSDACKEALHASLTVEYSMVGIKHTTTDDNKDTQDGSASDDTDTGASGPEQVPGDVQAAEAGDQNHV